MARSRNIKPAFFQNDILGELEPLARLLFIGMWTLADFKGCLGNRPKKLKAQILPYDNCDVGKLTTNLEQSGFIAIYSVEDQSYIKILNFSRHQNPHKNEREAGSDIPDFTEELQTKGLHDIAINRDKDGTNRDKDGTARADSLFLIPSSLIPDSLSPLPATPVPESAVAQRGFTSQEASDELNKHLDFVRSKFNLVQIKNERDWMEAVFRCEREKIDFQKLFDFIESKRDPTKSGSVTPKMMVSDNWIASFKNPTPKTEQDNGNARRDIEPIRYKSAAERNSEQVVRNFAALAKNRNANNTRNGSGNENGLLGGGETSDFESAGTSEPEHPF